MSTRKFPRGGGQYEADDPAARYSAWRLGAAGVITAAMVALLAGLGVAGAATSSLFHAVRTVGATGVLHRTGDSRGSGSSRGSASRIASLHALPSPGYFCATKGSKRSIKLILTQERYDRLTARNWALSGGPARTEDLARLSCASYKDDDSAD